jgi:hypothetical protein
VLKNLTDILQRELVQHEQPKLEQLGRSAGYFRGAPAPKNTCRISGAQTQIVCSADLPLFFDDAGWRRLIRIMF